MFALGSGLILWAWVNLSLGLPRHAGIAVPPQRLRARRLAGGLLLALSPAVFVAGWGWEFGLVYWAAMLMLCAIAWVLVLARWPRRRLRAAVVLSLVILALSWLAPSV
jgi:hypothetical protein